MSTVLIIGGYGAVGREAAAGLLRQDPEHRVILAGRRPEAAGSVPGTVATRLDAGDPEQLRRALDGVDVVLMSAEIDNARVARACLERGIHYLDVTASPHLLAAIEELDGLAEERSATAVLSVGLAPGVTNLLARHCLEDSASSEAEIGVLLGTGEHHGSAALAWTLDGLGRERGSWEMRFPRPYGTRTVHRFPFSDQYTLPRTLSGSEAVSIRTGLCLDSRALTGLLGIAARPGVARLLRRPAVRTALLSSASRIHLGSDGFAVTVRSGPVRASFRGHGQSRATGLVAAAVVERLTTFPSGVRHLDQLVDPVPFLDGIAARTGFTVELGD